MIKRFMLALMLGGLLGSGLAVSVGAQSGPFSAQIIRALRAYGLTSPGVFVGSSVTVTQGSLAADAQAISTTATWNNAGVTFTGWKENITNTASGSASNLIDLQVAGASIFKVRVDGPVTMAAADLRSPNWNIFSNANGSIQYLNAAANSGIQDTYGADVTVTTCGTGTVTAGSKNAAGNIVATGATACTVTFASPTFTNKPFCVAVAESGLNPTVVVNTTVSFTVTGLTIGSTFNYLCRGRI